MLLADETLGIQLRMKIKKKDSRSILEYRLQFSLAKI